MAAGVGKQYSNIRKIIYNAGVETIAEYATTSKVKRKAPDVRLVASPWFLPFVPIEFVSNDVGGLILSCEFAKSRSAPHGSVSITMAADDKKVVTLLKKDSIRTIRDILRPRTLVQLWLDGYHVLTGFVTTIRRSVAAGQTKVYSIQIDEISVLYQQSILDYSTIKTGAEINMVSNIWKILADGSRKLGSTLSVTIYELFEAFRASTLLYGTNGFFRASDGLPVAYRLVTAPPPIGGISLTGILSQMIVAVSMFSLAGGQTFWDFIKGYVPQPFMEMWTESGGRTMCVGRTLPSSDPTNEKLGLNKENQSFAGKTSGEGGSFTAKPDGASNTLSSPDGFSNVAKSGGVNPLSLAQLASSPFMSGVNISAMLPGFNYLVMRTAPYDNLMIGSSLWHSVLSRFALDVWDLVLAGDYVIVTDDDVISKDLGQSDIQQYTLFDVMYTGGAGAGNSVTTRNRPSYAKGPLNPLSPGGVRSYGGKILKVPINAQSIAWQKIVGQQIERITRRRGQPPTMLGVSSLSSMLNYWFRNAARFNEGTIVTRAYPYARPGMVLLYLPAMSGSSVEFVGDIGLYYIDNVSHSYSAGQVPTTTFSVIRGTPLPLNFRNLITVLSDWEVLPVNLNIADGF